MRGLLDLLARAKLIELSESERAPPSLPENDSPPAEEPAPQVPQPPVSGAQSQVEEGKSLEDIYALAALPPSVFPAEKLLRLLDGLRAMDAATRKTAVLAIDAADDAWQIADPVMDAQRKMEALEGYKQRLAELVRGAEQNAAAQMAEIKSGLEHTTGEIRTQISELERLLEREVTKAAQQTTNLEAGLRATREAAARELRRMEKEIERLSEIPANFVKPNAET